MKEGWQKLFFREASSCEARARQEGLPTGECGTHREDDRRKGVSAICGAGRKAVEAPLLALRHSANTSSFPVAFARFRIVCHHTKDGVEAGPVRNLKERWGVGTEGIRKYSRGVFGERGQAAFLQKEF